MNEAKSWRSKNWRIDVPVPIWTERLELRSCQDGDGAALADAISESYDDLYPWFHDGLGPRDLETSPAWQDVVACRSLAQFKARERLQFLAWQGEGQLVGSIEFFQPDWRRRSFHLAYWVRSSLQQQGYGVEMLASILRYSFDVLAARRILVGHAAPNKASAALIAKLGFRELSRLPMGSEMPDGTFVDGISYVMTDSSRLPATKVRW